MTHRTSSERGVTMIELMVVVSIIGIVAAASAISMQRGRPRASLSGAAVELRSVMTLARSRALMSGANVVVMFFPNYSGIKNSTGRVVVYQDAAFDFFLPGSAVHFGGYNPATPAAGPKGEVIATIDLPNGVVVGPATGMGSTATLPAPFTTLPVNQDCTFCLGAGAARRGAVVFNSRGRASFYNADANPLPVDGGSISLTSTELTSTVPLVRMLSISATTGALQSVNQG
jgi:prepilin-type N-terminal cleavage/methylation domain-containing protein